MTVLFDWFEVRYKDKKSKAFLCLVTTALLYYFANGYRFFTDSFSGDSLTLIYQDDSAWQIAIGRFVRAFLPLVRGSLTNPFMLCLFSCFWLILAVIGTVNYLGLESRGAIILLSSVMTCNVSLLATNVSYLHEADFYMFALFLAVSGVRLADRKGIPYALPGGLLLALSMGTYQAYICFAIGLVMLKLLIDIKNYDSPKAFWKQVLNYGVAFALSGGVYFAGWKICQKAFGIWTANGYNGLADLGDYADTNIGELLLLTYRNVFTSLFRTNVFATNEFRDVSLSIVWSVITKVSVALILALTVVLFLRFLVSGLKGQGLWKRIPALLLLLLFPFGVNVVCFLSKGMEHDLMIYSFCLVYALGIVLIDHRELYPSSEGEKHRSGRPFAVVFAVPFLILTWCFVIFSNQIYLKMDLEDRASCELLNRVVYDIEHTEGYVPGETIVALCGFPQNSNTLLEIEGFEELNLYGMTNSPMSYYGTEKAYLKYIFKGNMIVSYINTDDPAVQDMPAYPNEGYIRYVGDLLVVKFE